MLERTIMQNSVVCKPEDFFPREIGLLDLMVWFCFTNYLQQNNRQCVIRFTAGVLANDLCPLFSKWLPTTYHFVNVKNT